MQVPARTHQHVQVPVRTRQHVQVPVRTHQYSEQPPACSEVEYGDRVEEEDDEEDEEADRMDERRNAHVMGEHEWEHAHHPYDSKEASHLSSSSSPIN